MHYAIAPEDVILMNELLLGRTGTLLDRGKLESALARPLHGYCGVAVFPTVYDRAAALVGALCQAHAFIDGNKRTAMLSLEAYVAGTNIRLHQIPPELYANLLVDVANHTISVPELSDWIRTNSYYTPHT